MRTVAFVLGVLVAIAGGVFTLQGVDILQGSTMTGDPKWAVIGAVMLVVGIAAIVFGLRGKKRQT